MGLGVWSMGYGARSVGHGVWDMGQGMWGKECGVMYRHPLVPWVRCGCWTRCMGKVWQLD